MKKVMACLLALSLCIGSMALLSGCADGGTTSSDPSTESSMEESSATA